MAKIADVRGEVCMRNKVQHFMKQQSWPRMKWFIMWEILNILQQKFTITSIDSEAQTLNSYFIGGPVIKNPPANAGDMGSIPGQVTKIQHVSVQFSSVQLLSCVWLLWPHKSQHARPPCPTPTPGIYSNSCPSSQWCHPAISCSVDPFSSCSQSLPASGSFPMSQLFAWGGQSIGVSASASVLPMNIQDWSPLEWTGWISLQSKGLSRVFSNTTVQKHQFFSVQLSSQSNSHIHTWPLEKPWPWLDGPFLAK